MKHGYLIDMDGVIYKGSEIIPGAPEFISYLQDTGTPYLFLTNNSTYTPLDVVVKLRKFDIHTTVEHVYTSALATAEFVHRQRPLGTAFVIGEGGLLNALNDVQYAISKERPDYVIVGEGRVLNFELVEQAHRCIADGAALLSTNADHVVSDRQWSAARLRSDCRIAGVCDGDARVSRRQAEPVHDAGRAEANRPEHG